MNECDTYEEIVSYVRTSHAMLTSERDNLTPQHHPYIHYIHVQSCVLILAHKNGVQL